MCFLSFELSSNAPRTSSSSGDCDEQNDKKTCRKDMGVSKNRGTPKSSQFDRVWNHYFHIFSPSILGGKSPSPYFWFNPSKSHLGQIQFGFQVSTCQRKANRLGVGYGMDMGVEPKIGGWIFLPKWMVEIMVWKPYVQMGCFGGAKSNPDFWFNTHMVEGPTPTIFSALVRSSFRISPDEPEEFWRRNGSETFF